MTLMGQVVEVKVEVAFWRMYLWAVKRTCTSDNTFFWDEVRRFSLRCSDHMNDWRSR